MDIFAKYDFLKHGKIKISQKTCKFICSRVKGHEALIFLLDALFVLLNIDLRKMHDRGRFVEYKRHLTKPETVNQLLRAVFETIKSEPARLADQIQKSSNCLQAFYDNSIFCDLITLENCKEILWVV